jgi:ribonuclease HI
MQVASSHKFVLFAFWLLHSTTTIPTAAFVFEPSRARTRMMMMCNPRTMRAIAGRSTLFGRQSLRLFTSKLPTDSLSFELKGNVNMTIKAVPDKLARRANSSALNIPLTRTAIHGMNTDQLLAALEKLGMPVDGNKTERAERLLAVTPPQNKSKIKIAPKSAAPTINNHINNNNHIINNNNHFNNTTNNITNQMNETVYQEITPIMPSEESIKETGPVKIPPAIKDMDETTSSEDSHKEPGPVNPKRNYTLRVKGVSTKGTGGTGVGIVLEDSKDPTLCWTARKYLLGDRSVFEAEYTGLVVGLRHAELLGVRNIKLEIDHDVTTGHLMGVYEVTKPALIPMYKAIMEILDSMQSFSISPITKKENYNAKDLADKALATRTSVKIEDSVDPMEDQDSQVKKGQKLPEQQQKPIEVSVDPLEDQDREVKKEPKLPEQQQEPSTKPTEQVTPVETNESSVAETVQPEGTQTQIDPTREYKLEFDGGARGNQYTTAGKSGAGAVLYDDRGVEVWCAWKYLGKMTNNAAEYEALLLGLLGAKSLGIKKLKAFGDSQLIVNQMNGKNKVVNRGMLEYWKKAKPLTRDFKSINISHFLREENKRADELANHAMDTETSHEELRRFD